MESAYANLNPVHPRNRNQAAIREPESFIDSISTCACKADLSLEGACQELQLSVDQVLEKLTDSEAQEGGGMASDPATLSLARLVQHIVRVHHHCVRQELPRLAEMACKGGGETR